MTTPIQLPRSRPLIPPTSTQTDGQLGITYEPRHAGDVDGGAARVRMRIKGSATEGELFEGGLKIQGCSNCGGK